MSDTINKSAMGAKKDYLVSCQTCVKSIRNSKIPLILRAETEKFIERNTLADCGKVPPNCLKAFMIKTAQKMGLKNIIPNLKSLFKSKVGYRGYFLDGGKLFHVDIRDNQRQFS